MKKILSATILTLIFQSAVAQMEWGVKIGAGSTNMGGGSNTGFDVGFGAFAKAELKDRFGLQFDAMYSIKQVSKDTKISDSLAGTTKTNTTLYNFRYVEIPVQVYFPFSPHLSLLVGLNFVSVSSGRFKGEDDNDWTDIEGAEASMGIVGGLKYETATGWDFNFRYITADGAALAGQASSLQLTIGKFINW